MIGLLLAFAAQASSLAAPPFERADREDTIYELSGDPEKLAEFEQSLAEWEGGELIYSDEEEGVYVYWAYSERTAGQAREFLIPAAMSGLQLGIFRFDEDVAFPEMRAAADSIAVDCGATSDPFFIAPNGKVQIPGRSQMEDAYLSCLQSGAERLMAEGPTDDPEQVEE